MFDSKNNILTIIIFLFIFYCIYEINNLKNKLTNKVENFTTQDDINTAVKKIYLADVEAIRLLSNFAIQLSQGGFTIPGNVNINGELRTNNMIVTPHDHVIMCNGTQQIRSENDLYLLPRGNVILGNNGGGSGNLIANGNIHCTSMTTNASLLANTISFTNALNANGPINTPNDHIISCSGTQQIRSTRDLYLLPRGKVIISGENGGNGDLIVNGTALTNILIANTIKIGNTVINESHLKKLL